MNRADRALLVHDAEITPDRHKALVLCAHPDGLRPVGTQWKSVYWLHEQGLVRRHRIDRLSSIYFITDEGRAFVTAKAA